jgi:apolipoprotein D and lipocalin family protein
MAKYWLLDSGDIGVRNSCTTTDGDEISIEGSAAIVDPVNQAKLNVVFNTWWAKIAALFTSPERGNYWILRVDPDYQFAVVGTPDLGYLWILARAQSLDEATYQELVAFSRGLGFQTENLVRRQTSEN